MNLKDYIALYAAVVATAGLVWNIIQWLKQKGLLEVRTAICENNGQYTLEVDPGQWGDLLRVDVVNSGKSDLTLTEIGLETARPKPLFFWQKLPQARFVPPANQTPLNHTLEPSKTVHWLLDSTDFLLGARTINRVFVKDSHGREWNVSKKQVKQMNTIIQLERQRRESQRNE